MGGSGINLAEALAKIPGCWASGVVATVNDSEVRVARVRGSYLRHQHPDSDEFLLVLDGELVIELEGDRVVLGKGEAYLVPAGRYHRPVAHVETSVLLLEPRTVQPTAHRRSVPA